MQENSKNISSIKRNILQYLDFKGVSEYQFYKDTGVSRGTLKNFSGLTEENIAKFIAYAPEVNIEWLLMSRGDMIKRPTGFLSEPAMTYKSENQIQKGVPLLSVDAIAGFGAGNWSITEADVKERYLVPDFKKIDFMIHVKGPSMYPKYESGDIVACRKLTNNYIQWNKTHVVSTKEQGIMVKRIKKSDRPDHYLMVSENPEFEPFDIPVDEIDGIALVIGIIRLE
jgi:repressor LexA